MALTRFLVPAFAQKPWLWPLVTLRHAGLWSMILSGTSASGLGDMACCQNFLGNFQRPYNSIFPMNSLTVTRARP